MYGNQLKTVFKNVFSNVQYLNNNSRKITESNLKIHNIVKSEKFMFFDIVKDNNFKKNQVKSVSLCNKNNKLYNEIINALGSQTASNYLLRLQ